MAADAHIDISPSLLSADFARLGSQVQEAAQAGADSIHVDVMDGHFVPNISFGEMVVDAVRRSTTLPLNIHLMVREPDYLIPGFAKSGSDQIIVHAEACTHLHRTVYQVKDLGCEVGVALNPGTPGSAIEDLISFLDIVMVMTVNPGFGGQSFIPSSIEKIRRIRELASELGCSPRIEVDGGVKADESARESVRAGATILVAGSAIYNQQETVSDAMARLRDCIDGIKLDP